MVILDEDKNTLKCNIDVNQGVISLDVENLIAPYLDLICRYIIKFIYLK